MNLMTGPNPSDSIIMGAYLSAGDEEVEVMESDKDGRLRVKFPDGYAESWIDSSSVVPTTPASDVEAHPRESASAATAIGVLPSAVFLL